MHQTIKQRCRSCGNTATVLIGTKFNPRPECPICGASLGIEVEEVKGFVYVLSNPAMPNILKIGFTDVDVFERCKELSRSTGVPTPFEVDAYFVSQDARSLEQQFHTYFDEQRFDKNREFFSLTIHQLLDNISEHFDLKPGYLRSALRIKKSTDGPSAAETRNEAQRSPFARASKNPSARSHKGPNYQKPPYETICPQCRSRYYNEWIERCRTCRTKLLDIPPLSYSNLRPG